MKDILIIGSGGREHALALAFARSPQVEQVYVAPGNPGMVMTNHNIECVNIPVTEIERLAEFVEGSAIDLTFVGPEQPLELGIVDYFISLNLPIIGPTKAAARLENSKNFAKDIMSLAEVKTAKHRFFQAGECQEAIEYAEALGLPFVIKADGLMSGKGVVIPETMEEAVSTLELMMDKNNKEVLIEEFLTGTEFSHFSLVNGSHIISLGTACDYKRALDNDLGLNTGGMGSFAPVPWFDEEAEQRVLTEIVHPIANQMIENETPFTGILYTGIIWTSEGPKVIEFNTRLGDPETQVLLTLLENDFYEVAQAHLDQSPIDIRFKKQFNLGVVLAAEGYPSLPKADIPLNIPKSIEENIYFAGVGGSPEMELLSKGGRILMVTSSGDTIEEAREKVYNDMKQFDIQDTFYRTDIGLHRNKEA
ncbi:phosphoribosylamine--glycine ligase [Ruoffia tabacinasalis]|uniref:Phosphoribosylamine--glycine ligase n=1 Tax=Ruoffia tabacinasalis TaxID=87458 RepID=A0A5R9EK49_9LACT|nr:phosphoribosylamine--glycine ligase [Ruoffia tabacinasalis]TLQ49443.1 phosphoribosylamine--glycine ligase [Ruoffia tabacinasalis]